jgi:hypothetical protein
MFACPDIVVGPHGESAGGPGPSRFFDISLLSKLTNLTFTATLPMTVFDPVFRDDPYTKFIASSATVSASQSRFPPPLDVAAQGRHASFIARSLSDTDQYCSANGGHL